MSDDLTAHLLADDGVTPVRFERTGGTFTSLDDVTMRNGDVLDLGAGVRITLGDLPVRQPDPGEFDLRFDGLDRPL